jgi:hypothetical protein
MYVCMRIYVCEFVFDVLVFAGCAGMRGRREWERTRTHECVVVHSKQRLQECTGLHQ